MKIMMVDCEGTLRPVENLISVTLECFREYFNVQIRVEEIAKKVSSLSGGTFAEAYQKALKLFVPGYDEQRDKEKAGRCYKKLLEKRTEAYKEIEAFPEVVDTLKKLSESYHLIISTGLERIYIEEWLVRIGINNLFEAIYSAEDGNKEKHIQMIRERHSDEEEKILFVGDATLEMQLGVPGIGVARNSSQEQPLWDAGAKAVVHSLDEILNLNLDLLWSDSDSLRSDSDG